MCVICLSPKGTRQPSIKEMYAMWEHNPHGAGYMVSRPDGVYIHKGFMTFSDFCIAIKQENFTKDDVVAYHFRISTQAGVNPEMTHPFALTSDLTETTALDVKANVGIVHNGIIPMTSYKGSCKYSDTALFVATYLPHLIHTVDDIEDEEIVEIIEELIHSKMVLMSPNGKYSLVGRFETVDGLIYSNTYHIVKPTKYKSGGYQFSFSDRYVRK